jgi:hypothetical protein
MQQSVFSQFKVPVVQCKFRKKEMPMLECIDSYVNANAMPNRRSACFRCTQGQRTRSQFAGS